MWQQAWSFGTRFPYMRRAESLSGTDGHYRLRLSDGGVLTARTVVIATGATYRRLGIPRLEDLQGRGVFYGAAASEAPVMRGRNVFVAGGGNSAGQTALHLAKWAGHVTILVRAKSPADSMSDYLIRQIGSAPNVDVCYHVQVADGTGTGRPWPSPRPPLPLETSLPGVFAAGDVRRGSVNRVASAVGEGAATVPLAHR
jgi:thioredoxin reductase (NADPH)